MRSGKIIMMLILGSALLLSGCVDTDDITAQTASVEQGDTVTLDYTLMTENGTVIETSNETVAENNDIMQTAEPLVFEVGSEQTIMGIDEGVVGMSEGEQKELTLPPEQAFGPYREELVQEIPIQEYQNATNTTEVPQPGEQLMSQMGVITVTDVNDTHIVLDANSPFANETIVFDITVVSVEKGEVATEGVEESIVDEEEFPIDEGL
ncbi:FKBP-type peptidyl-prolyl cis-trans isomerase [Methanolobus halotolerans]|uniref:Peptidyl-prolyl cis-trans isomerase n=1 Tax=Methanolobus halotolerans TaxID=2052935 RepID=A0A4E0Q9D0_9EURY|nr:FKBP-type peptidyl-prolyl cis-trans isomerase [Methanolobus halotolerans]TGC11594.1 peptidylprolyl isomerase [Methanolobus halotolerans]